MKKQITVNITNLCQRNTYFMYLTSVLTFFVKLVPLVSAAVRQLICWCLSKMDLMVFMMLDFPAPTGPCRRKRSSLTSLLILKFLRIWIFGRCLRGEKNKNQFLLGRMCTEFNEAFYPKLMPLEYTIPTFRYHPCEHTLLTFLVPCVKRQYLHF